VKKNSGTQVVNLLLVTQFTDMNYINIL